MPPLVGWAAATGNVGLAALLLFAIVFVWTPPHFWALALMLKEHYARAGVPMLPVTRGDRETAKQILRYTVLLVIATLAPVAFGVFGIVYSLLYSKKSNRPGDLFEACMFLVIGLFCAFVCVRWCRMKIRRPQQRSTGR